MYSLSNILELIKASYKASIRCIHYTVARKPDFAYLSPGTFTASRLR